MFQYIVLSSSIKNPCFHSCWNPNFPRDGRAMPEFRWKRAKVDLTTDSAVCPIQSLLRPGCTLDALIYHWESLLMSTGNRIIFELTLIVGSAGLLDPPFHRSVGLKAIEWGPASERYSLGFLEHIWSYLLEIDAFFGSKWVPESSCQGLFLKNCCQFQLVTSCKGASVQRLLCVKAFVCKSFCV